MLKQRDVWKSLLCFPPRFSWYFAWRYLISDIANDFSHVFPQMFWGGFVILIPIVCSKTIIKSLQLAKKLSHFQRLPLFTQFRRSSHICRLLSCSIVILNDNIRYLSGIGNNFVSCKPFDHWNRRVEWPRFRYLALTSSRCVCVKTLENLLSLRGSRILICTTNFSKLPCWIFLVGKVMCFLLLLSRLLLDAWWSVSCDARCLKTFWHISETRTQ